MHGAVGDTSKQKGKLERRTAVVCEIERKLKRNDEELAQVNIVLQEIRWIKALFEGDLVFKVRMEQQETQRTEYELVAALDSVVRTELQE